MAGTPKVKMSDILIERLEELASQGEAIAKGLRGSEQRFWQVPEKDGEPINPLDNDQVISVFDRAEINQQYEEALKDGSDPGTTSDLGFAKMQIDYLAVQERAFRHRHMSRARAQMHSAARRKGHGLGDGIFQGSILTYLQEVEKSGQIGGG